MRRKSHIALGRMLAINYMNTQSPLSQLLFRFGCIEPDMNPLSYFKGSLRHQFLKGHNSENSKEFIRKHLYLLEKKHTYSYWDYYTMGKLIHYIADSFTFAHCPVFSGNIHNHRIYEQCLQEFFLENGSKISIVDTPKHVSNWEILNQSLLQYNIQPKCPQTDTKYIITVSSIVLQKLISS